MRETVGVLSGREVSLLRAAADSLTEDEAKRQLYFAAGGLVLLGVVLLIGTIWWWRSTRPESPALAPLEVMSGRRWSHASEAERRRLADGVRPHPGPADAEAPVPIPLDEARVEDPEGDRFDDLREFDGMLGLEGAAASAVAASAVEPAGSEVDDGASEADTDGAEASSASVAPDSNGQAASSVVSTEAADEALAGDEVAVDPAAANGQIVDGENAADDDDLAAVGDEDDDDDDVGESDETHMIAIDPLLRLSRPD